MFIRHIDKRIILIVVTLSIAIGIVFVSGPIRNGVTASSRELPTPQTLKNQEGFSLELTYANRSGDFVRAEFCYELPTNEDWQVGKFGQGVTLTAGETTYPVSHGGLSLKESPVNTQGEKRCSYVDFDVPKEQELGEVAITVDRLMTSLPEVYDCEKAQQKLENSNKGKGIVVNCRIGDHSSGFDIVNKPMDMSNEKAAELAIDEGFSSTIYGPWKFFINIE